MYMPAVIHMERQGAPRTEFQVSLTIVDSTELKFYACRDAGVLNPYNVGFYL